MNISIINERLALGDLDHPSVLPHLTRLKDSPFVFEVDFGLDELPTKPGILLIRGARQYGKSTWLEQQVKLTIEQYGAGSAFYLNGDYILNLDKLEAEIDKLLATFAKDAAVKRIFIDEITAIENWTLALKRMADSGKLNNVLVVTTGSNATDLRRGVERLPGRKGKLDRTEYIFTPIAYREFKRVCGKKIGNDTLWAYLLSGGSPIACTELAEHGRIPEYVIELVRDWIDGEIERTGRSRSSLLDVMNVLFRMATNQIGQTKLAREAGLANNTVAKGYIDALQDLACVTPAYPWDQHKDVLIKRKACKYHLTNLLVAVVFHPAQIRSVADFNELPNKEQGFWLEWLVSQEILRRKSIKGGVLLEPLGFWQSKEQEIDFVLSNKHLLEVKRGKTSPLEFAWFNKQFPNAKLTVISDNNYKTDKVLYCQLEEFLLEE